MLNSGTAASGTSGCNSSPIGSTDSISDSGFNDPCSCKTCDIAAKFLPLRDAGVVLRDKTVNTFNKAAVYGDIEALSQLFVAASVSLRCSSACACTACAIVRGASKASNFCTMFATALVYSADGNVAATVGGTKFTPCGSRTCSPEYFLMFSNQQLTEYVTPKLGIQCHIRSLTSLSRSSMLNTATCVLAILTPGATARV